MIDKRLRKLLDRYRVTGGKGFRLKDHDPGDSGGLDLDKETAQAMLAESTSILAEQQDKLYAQDRWSVLCIFQAMDAAGKDGAVKHVFTGVNPQGCHVVSFKAPSAAELDHDFLWRHAVALPQRGQIGIHNRSWYEEVLVVRVHQKILAAQKLPEPLVGKHIFDERLEDIAAYERYLARQGVVILKFFLNVSKDEQRKRFLERIEQPEKNWKFNGGDVAERAHWKAYQSAYEDAIRATAAPHAPWFVVPADNKRFTRIIVADAIAEAMDKLDLRYPSVDDATRAELATAKQSLG
ncbi:MAG TPA: polyphosphate kinase 2 family protein [Roseomonas sp.]|jgi:PPK2 family polyphosphate:nucleotide phosphotransferase